MTSKFSENTTIENYSKNNSISGLIRTHSAKFPGKVAIKHNNSVITYSELERASNQIANFFLAENIKKNDVISVSMDRSIEMSVCLYSIMKAGATYLPIDPNLPTERVSFLLKDTSSKLLITSQKYQSFYNKHETLIFDEIWLNRNSYSADFLNNNSIEDDIIYIIYTSGSTGVPKGVGIKQKSLLNLLQFRQYSPGIFSTDNMLGITTMSFDISQEELYLPLISGGQLTIVDKDIAKDGQALLETIKKEKITVMQATPYVWQMMLEIGWNSKLPLKAFCGGEALTKDLADKLLQRCDEVWNMYGPTETTICCIVKKLSADDKIITIGKPIANTFAYVLDEYLNEVPEGEEGELYIGGIGVSEGYINRAELTGEKFIKDKFSDDINAKMYKTGDLVKTLKNGDIQFIGRIDNQIKIRGYRIETEEIEFHLKKNKHINDALVMVYVDDLFNSRLIAYLILSSSDEKIQSKKLIHEIKEQLKKLLPDYMVPVDYILLEHMPLMPSGKVDRNSLPKPKIKSNALVYVAPQTELEKIVASVWIKNIGIKKISINDNFFELGGTSLIAVKTKIELEEITSKRLSPSILFKYPTIRQLALLIQDTSVEKFKSLIPIKPEGSKIPLYMVHGIGLNVLNFRQLAMAMDDDQPIYGMQAVLSKELCHEMNTIEEIAGFYNSEILSQNPEGPYAISGYSIGGVIAYEMVKQLQSKGKEVRLLVMFDTAVQIPSHQYKLLRKIAVKSLRQVSKLKFRITSFIKEPIKNIKFLKVVYRKKIGKIFYNNFNPYDLPDYMGEIINRITTAFYKYKIEPYPVKIDLFVAKKLYYLDDPRSLGWKKYALNGVNIYNISSGHDDMFEQLYYQEIAGILQKRLNEIND